MLTHFGGQLFQDSGHFFGGLAVGGLGSGVVYEHKISPGKGIRNQLQKLGLVMAVRFPQNAFYEVTVYRFFELFARNRYPHFKRNGLHGSTYLVFENQMAVADKAPIGKKGINGFGAFEFFVFT